MSVEYSESDELKDGIIYTTRSWLYDQAPSPEVEAKIAKVREILGDDGLIYNVRMDVSTWKDWEGFNSFGDGKIIRAKTNGHMCFAVDNLFHDERHLREWSPNVTGALFEAYNVDGLLVEWPGPYLRAYFAATMDPRP